MRIELGLPTIICCATMNGSPHNYQSSGESFGVSTNCLMKLCRYLIQTSPSDTLSLTVDPRKYPCLIPAKLFKTFSNVYEYLVRTQVFSSRLRISLHTSAEISLFKKLKGVDGASSMDFKIETDKDWTKLS